MKYERPFSRVYRADPGKKWQTELVFSSKILTEKLMARGLLPRKSYINPPPMTCISDDLYHHFARGWLDGDGSIAYGKKNRLPTPVIRWYGSKDAIHDFGRKISNLVGVSFKNPYPTHNTLTNKCWGVAWAAWKEVSRIVQWLHKDGGVYAPRKHDIPRKQVELYLNGEEYRVGKVDFDGDSMEPDFLVDVG
jgi:hypothetical protein